MVASKYGNAVEAKAADQNLNREDLWSQAETVCLAEIQPTQKTVTSYSQPYTPAGWEESCEEY